ncbi:uncharacterized protein LOC143063127 [Mytilus galloprovincialis]|uniref:uncharacterized protein LOC143063127 n=1 Tax=Mytilus galloprovincialis TaxID=29158 RepID=UPI003F7CBEFB
MMIYYKDVQFWQGKWTAYGGLTGSSPGGAGTIYLQDTITDVINRTLILDNHGQSVIQSEISTYTLSGYEADPGRTWISDNNTNHFENLRIKGKANLALHPSLTDPFQLKSLKFEGDKTGVLHVGPGQTVVVQHPDDLEFLVNVYVYQGGTLILPTAFDCYGIDLVIWGTLGVVDMTIGNGCDLHLGSTGNTQGISTVSPTGIFDFNTLTVKAGGEVTVTHDLTDGTSSMAIIANKLWVQGGGHVHAVHVDITADTLIVDDLGKIIGDIHNAACSKGDGYSSSTGGSGAGHGGRGGQGSGQTKTGAPYGQVFDAVDRGCRGGDNGNANTGGRGGGVITLKMTTILQNDGQISVNGENGKSSSAGGGSGGSINIDTNNIKGYGEFQSIGGNGNGNGGAGSGGRISMEFSQNKTFTGQFDTYGGLGQNNGSPGTSFFHHKVYDHTTLLLNNLNRGPAGDTNTIEDYLHLDSDQLKAWFLPEHGKHTFAGSNSKYHFDELQIYGKAQLAVLTDPVESEATIYFENMIGDRSGAIHVGKGQVMDLERQKIDLPFSVHVYDGGYLGLAPDTFIHGVDIFLNGTLANVDNLTLHHEGKLWLNIDGRTKGLDASTYSFQFVHVKNAGYLHMISDPVSEPSIYFSTVALNIDGGGLVRGTYVVFHSENITIDSGGTLTADGLGYEQADGQRTDSSGNPRKGLHGVVNPGLGLTGSLGASGAGHGGSGGRGFYNDKGGEPYGDLYEPTLFGSSGGGHVGGAGGGRLWLNVTNTIMIDGTLTASAENGQTQYNYNSIASTGWVTDYPSGGGSGGSIWLHCYRITGYGTILAHGGNGTKGTYRHTGTDGSGHTTYPSTSYGAGGGAGGRIAMYFQKNDTFSEFRYLANGGWPGLENAEVGGPGTVYLYHTNEDHRTLIIDNNGAPEPLNQYVNWNDVTKDGGRAWILPQSGIHDFAAGSYIFRFEEIQIYGNGHLAVLNPSEISVIDAAVSGSVSNINVTIDFKYMIGDRSGTVHVADKQVMDLNREEIDLPFNCYVYFDGFLGLAPMTYVHGVEIHLAGVLANIENITIHHGGYLWLQNGGRTQGNPYSHYTFDYVLVQDQGKIDCTTDAVTDIGIYFHLKAVTVEGGGIIHGTHMTYNVANVTVDAGGVITTEGKGYITSHSNTTHFSTSVHGHVNPGKPLSTYGGGGHGGSAGEGYNSQRAGFAYGNIYEPIKLGSSAGSGGTGGGVIWMNVTHTIHIDGEVNSEGGDGTAGGSGGSVWMFCELIKGYGKITSHGGNATHSNGGGGAGGRVAVYFNRNETMTSFRFQAIGGKGGASGENGGAGTVFVYHMGEDHKTLIIDNGGHQPKDKFNVIDDYSDLSSDSCRTWILPESGDHFFAGGGYKYHFQEFQMYGAAHLAFLPEPLDNVVDVFFLYMIGDRSGTVHLGNNQIMDLKRDEIDLPFSVRAYAGSYLGLAPMTIVHGVSIWMHGELANIDNITLHHNGLLSLESGGFTKDLAPDHFQFNWVRVQENATIRSLTDPVTEPGIDFLVHFSMYVEGGGTFVATNASIQAINITIDDGGALHGDSLGYRSTDTQADIINIGKGITHTSGSSGAGHGGTSGRGAGTTLTGQPYGHLYQPFIHGSAGGGDGGQGGGMLWLNATNMIEIDGRLSANAGDAKAASGGGGSGGSVWIYCRVFRGLGTIAVNGGSQYSGGSGGGGAGGRIAVYLWINNTYLGDYESHGGSVNLATSPNSQPGGPGTVLLYHVEHDHETLYINNDGLESDVGMIKDYTDLSEDSFKAWILPNAGQHWLANENYDFQFEELQIYGNAHLALLPEPFEKGVSLHFQHMIGDRTGFVHVGNHQVMDLRRKFLDTPFNTYVYDGGYLGLAPDTNLERVFVRLEGTMDHVINMTLIDGGSLRLHLTGSTNNRDRLNYHINGTTVIKAKSYINCSNPRAHDDQYQLVLNHLRVEGGGAINGSFMRIQATDMFVDDGGIVSVNNGGHSTDQGPGVGQWHRYGASGASHGGTGGQGACSNHLSCKLSRSKAYGDLKQPLEFGSGGSGARGGSGGGRLEIKVQHTLKVDGYVMANSEDVLSVSSWSGASGGSAGSILINTVNFTGSHTGHIQALGGVADISIGGGGAGGRIALYQNTHHTIPPYRGFFDTYGGRGNSNKGSEAGASGTAFIQNTETGYSKLLVDNHNQLPRDEHSALLNEGYRTDLTIPESSYSQSSLYTSTKGHKITSTSNTYVYGYPCYSGNYYLMYLFDQTLASESGQIYVASSGSATITVELVAEAFVTKLKIYPTASFPSRFKVIGYNGATSFVVTTNYVEPRSPIIQGSYLELPVMQTATKFQFLVTSTRSSSSSCYYRASLTEIEIFADAKNVFDRYKYTDLDGATTWIFAKTDNEQLDFNEITVQGGGHLAFNSSVSLTSPVDINVGTFDGDRTGYIHIGYNQELSINYTNADIPFNTHVYENGKATYPPRPFFYGTHLYTSGEIQGIEDLYVFDGGSVTVDTNGSIGMTTPARVSLKSLHVQDKGTFQMDSYTKDNMFVMDSTNVTIYGGGHFKVNTGLNMTTHHLMAIFSGGLIDLDGQGLSQPEDVGPGYGTGSLTGGSGGGHGGSGGRGTDAYTVGQGYDSIYTPVKYGSPGGYGNYRDSLYFGDSTHRNTLVRGHIGGVSGGRIYLTGRHVDIDGEITVDGQPPENQLGANAGGGSGGSVWIVCDEVVGHGVITANGGNGNGQGGGGSGGRISIQSSNTNKLNITLKAYGGISNFESGGAGTKYEELFNATNKMAINKKLTVDNNGHTYPRAANIQHGDRRNLLNGVYDDISQSGGITWLYHDDPQYKFNTVVLQGNAHVAILSNTSVQDIDIRVEYLIGDTTGVLHAGKRQTFGFTNVDTYMPINIMCYRYSFLEIPERIAMREVWAEINGTIIGLDDISVENEGELYIWSYANTEGLSEGSLQLTNISVKAGGKFEPLTAEKVINITVVRVLVNGNGYVRTNHLKLHAVNVTIDLSGDFHADFTGHAGDIGPGAGLAQSNHAGASGGGHGGRGGRSYRGYFSAVAYDSIYIPSEMGSGGGTGSNGEGGRGGGKFETY